MMGYKIGDQIMRSEPLALVLKKEWIATKCDWCLDTPFASSPGKGLMRCAKCKFTRYCSKQCQDKAWREYHKKECKGI